MTPSRFLKNATAVLCSGVAILWAGSARAAPFKCEGLLTWRLHEARYELYPNYEHRSVIGPIAIESSFNADQRAPGLPKPATGYWFTATATPTENGADLLSITITGKDQVSKTVSGIGAVKAYLEVPLVNETTWTVTCKSTY